jgi:hypothetical protein
MRTLAILLVFASLCGYASAEPEAAPEPEFVPMGTITYEAVDLVAHTQANSIWAISWRDGAVKVQKEMPFSHVDETEIFDQDRVTRLEKLGIYQKIFHFAPTGKVTLGKRNMGYMETRDIKTNQLLLAHPLLFRVTGIGDALRLEYKVFLNDGQTLFIIRDYRPGEEYAPLMEQFTTLSMVGKVTHSVVFTRQEKK